MLQPATRELKTDSFNNILPSELKKQKKVYKCSVGTCRRMLDSLNEVEQKKKKQWWAGLVEEHGLEAARALVELTMDDNDF